jgi:hypothetical protein
MLLVCVDALVMNDEFVIVAPARADVVVLITLLAVLQLRSSSAAADAPPPAGRSIAGSSQLRSPSTIARRHFRVPRFHPAFTSIQMK